MTLADFITRVNYALRGTDDDAPTIGADEANYWVDTLNRKKDELYQDVSKLWSGTYAVDSLGTITASAAPSYALDATYLGGANTAYVVTTDDARIDFVIIHPEEINPTYTGQQVYVAGQDPQNLYFTREITSDDQIFGGTLYLPGYYMPEDVDGTDEDATIPLPDPNWGVMAVAAEVAFGDITYEDKAADLNAKANALYTQMSRNNRRGTYDNPRVSPTRVNRIPDTRRRGW